jgi:hypothetical protein
VTEPVRPVIRGAFKGDLSPEVVVSPASAARPAPASTAASAPQPAPAEPDLQSASNLPDDLRLERSRVAPGMYKPMPETTLFEWRAASRPFKRRNRQFFVTVTVIALLISLILFFSGQFLPIAVVISVVFLFYVLQVIPPHDIDHKISTYGITVDGTLYYWEEMGRFWFDTKYGQLLFNVEILRFPGRLTVVLPEQHRAIVSEIMTEVLLQQKPELTSFERAAHWFQEKLPLE